MSANRMGDSKRLMCANRRWRRWRNAGLNEQAMEGKRRAIHLRLDRIIKAVHEKEEREHRVIRFKGMEDPR